MEQPRAVRTTPPVTLPPAPISSPPSSSLPRDRAAHSFSPPLLGARFGSHADNKTDLLTADKTAVFVVLRQRRCTGGCGRWCAEAGQPVVCRLCGVPLRLVSALGALARVSSSSSYVLTAGRVNPDGGVSCIGGNFLHRRYLAARDRAN